MQWLFEGMEQEEIEIVIYKIIVMLSGLAIIFLSPVGNIKKELDYIEKKRYKKYTIFIVILWGMMAHVINTEIMLQCVCVAMLQMSIMCVMGAFDI